VKLGCPQAAKKGYPKRVEGKAIILEIKSIDITLKL
jgi:hypothetical protein